VPKLSDLAAPRKKITVGSGPDALTVEYNEAAWTPRFERELRLIRDDEEGDSAALTLLARLLVGWDLAGDDGAPIGTDGESLAEVPSKIVRIVMDAIVADILPNGSTPRSTGNSGSFS
jgi:hypothetical protein